MYMYILSLYFSELASQTNPVSSLFDTQHLKDRTGLVSLKSV